MPKVIDIYNTLDKCAPFCDAENWDNSGILVGDSEEEVDSVCVSLDGTIPVIHEASAKGAKLIVTHHPIIFNPIKTLSYNEPAFYAAYRGIAVISSHTNFDLYILSKLLLEKLGFLDKNAISLIPKGDIGYGKVIDFETPISCDDLVKRIKENLGIKFVRALAFKKEIKKLAVITGADNAAVKKAASAKVDALVIGEIKHSGYLDAANQVNGSINIFEIGHFHSENIFCEYVKNLLKEKFPSLTVFIAENNINPYHIV